MTRIGDPHSPQPPVIMIPGMFTSHSFWISPRDIGLAAHLANAGHCCYLIDRRGMGDSPVPESDIRAGLAEHVEQDLPVLAARIAQQHDQPAFWVGHSFGGVMASLALAGGQCGQPAGLVLFASQYAVGKRALTWPWSLLTRGMSHAMGRVPARRVGLGPEDESPEALDDACAWVARGRDSPWMIDALARIDCPVLGLAGAADTVDPPEGCRQFVDALGSRDKQFQVAGKAQGFAEDYNHPGIVVSRVAREDIWPRVSDWMAGFSPRN